MTLLIGIAIVAGGAVIGEAGHLVSEAVTRNKEMKALVKKNNQKDRKDIDEKTD